ncbi:endonuclease [Sphingomonas sp. Sph1(2015)]|jgi:hypothetical protein|uniref:HNH endonuclease n=1 Tax=Sphingomonas sp. Sph1(2015) TaxID=1628084 RepID=UPI00097605DC|nr:endonuclease [Sphingomonas sp. Sph1(2015)]OMJ31734.1 endonuclease [Sphingomonas sp. Sph1(2015)]
MSEIQKGDSEIIRRRAALERAIAGGRSVGWLHRLWSRFVKTRDGDRCLNCGQKDGIQAHHVMRRTLVPFAGLELGNGISLCRPCHKLVHAMFNGRPNPALPMGAAQGDDQEEWSFLFGILMDDATKRGLVHDELYFLSDELLHFSVAYQGYEPLLEAVADGEFSRLRFMHEIWRAMPEHFYVDLASELGAELLAAGQ